MQEIGQVEELIRSAERLAAASTTSKKDNPVQRKAIEKLDAYRQGLEAKAKAEEEAAAVVLDAAAEEGEECVSKSKVEVRGAETTTEATTEAPAKATARRLDVAPAAVAAVGRTSQEQVESIMDAYPLSPSLSSAYAYTLPPRLDPVFGRSNVKAAEQGEAGRPNPQGLF